MDIKPNQKIEHAIVYNNVIYPLCPACGQASHISTWRRVEGEGLDKNTRMCPKCNALVVIRCSG